MNENKHTEIKYHEVPLDVIIRYWGKGYREEVEYDWVLDIKKGVVIFKAYVPKVELNEIQNPER